MNNDMNQLLAQFLSGLLPWVLLTIIVVVLGTVFRVAILPKLKGQIGEASINSSVRRMLDQSVYHLIPDVMLPTPDGTTQIDHVIVSRYGIFVLETKNYKGWIFGDEREAQWTQTNYKRKDRFQNPLRQNYKHTKTLADLTGIPMEYFRSLVVFAGECTFKTAMPANVVYLRDFVPYINTFHESIIRDEQVSEIVSAIREWASTLTAEQKARHVAHLRRNQAPVSVDVVSPTCPRCGGTMILRTRRTDGGRFWGCQTFPKCKGTVQIGA